MGANLDETKKKNIADFLYDVLSLDVITAQGNAALEFEPSHSFLDTIKAHGNDITVLARTIIEFGGDRCDILATEGSNANSSLRINQEIMNYHNANVRTALENRGHHLQMITDLISKLRETLGNFDISDIFEKLLERKATSNKT
jgi:hypothetical protein